MDWLAVGVTLRLAVGTTAILFVVGLPLAYWLATSRARGIAIVQAVVTLPLVLPPTVVGFYLLLLLGPRGPFGDLALAFRFPGVLLASVLVNLPFAVRPFAAAFAAIDPHLLEASWCLGVSRWRTFLRVALPLAAPGVLAGCAMTFAHTLGEFGVVLMLGGGIPGETRTLSIAIYDDVQALDYAAAGRTSLALVVAAVAILGGVHVWLRPARAV